MIYDLLISNMPDECIEWAFRYSGQHEIKRGQGFQQTNDGKVKLN